MRTLVLIALVVSWAGSAWAIPQDEYLAVETIYLEAGNQSLEGQIAVGEVIRTRMRQKGLKEVITKPYAFSCWNNARNAQKRLEMASSQSIQTAWKAWEASSESNLTHRATHYFNPGLANPSWAKRMDKTVAIGNHTFYKER